MREVQRPPETVHRAVIRFAGDSGDGMQLAGDRFSIVSAVFAPFYEKGLPPSVYFAILAVLMTVMLGDFNDWFWPGSLRHAFKQELPARTRHATFPSRCPIFRLDRIFCWPGDTKMRSFVDHQARVASDHLPVVADLLTSSEHPISNS